MDRRKYADALYMITGTLNSWRHTRAQLTDAMQVGHKPAVGELGKIDARIQMLEYVLGILPKENE